MVSRTCITETTVIAMVSGTTKSLDFTGDCEILVVIIVVVVFLFLFVVAVAVVIVKVAVVVVVVFVSDGVGAVVVGALCRWTSSASPLASSLHLRTLMVGLWAESSITETIPAMPMGNALGSARKTLFL